MVSDVESEIMVRAAFLRTPRGRYFDQLGLWACEPVSDLPTGGYSVNTCIGYEEDKEAAYECVRGGDLFEEIHDAC